VPGVRVTPAAWPERPALIRGKNGRCVRAYKFLSADRRSQITGFRWPAFDWVEAVGPLELCRNGIHACRIEHLPHWIGPELWAMEIDGELREGPDAVVARRGRLVQPVEAWADGAGRELAEDCARRAQGLAGDRSEMAARAADAVADAADGWFSASAYIAAAVAAQVRSGAAEGPLYDRHFLAERARQAAWLKERLGLIEG
jgi:hypothetical protein